MIDTLTQMCDNYNLTYDNSISPIKIGPDCYMFYATHLSHECRTAGYCKEDKYYALTGGSTIVILNKDMNRIE